MINPLVTSYFMVNEYRCVSLIILFAIIVTIGSIAIRGVRWNNVVKIIS